MCILYIYHISLSWVEDKEDGKGDDLLLYHVYQKELPLPLRYFLYGEPQSRESLIQTPDLHEISILVRQKWLCQFRCLKTLSKARSPSSVLAPSSDDAGSP